MSKSFAREFKLGRPGGAAPFPSIDENGAFYRGVPLLEKTSLGQWRPRPQATMEKLFGDDLGGPLDIASRMGRLTAVARALNAGDLALAAIALLQAELPEWPAAARPDGRAGSNSLCKDNYNVGELRDAHHQRWIAEGDGAAI